MIAVSAIRIRGTLPIAGAIPITGATRITVITPIHTGIGIILIMADTEMVTITGTGGMEIPGISFTDREGQFLPLTEEEIPGPTRTAPTRIRDRLKTPGRLIPGS